MTKLIESGEYTLRMNLSDTLLPGDIGAVYEKSIVGRLSEKLITPRADFFHFFLVADYIPTEMDFIIYESIPSHGVAVGRLSWYFNDKVTIFRPDPNLVSEETGQTPEHVGYLAVWNSTSHGRIGYDYILCLKIFYKVLKSCFLNLIRQHRFQCSYTDIPISHNRRLLCTEMVDEAYYKVYRIFNREYELLPSNFMDAVLMGRVNEVYNW